MKSSWGSRRWLQSVWLDKLHVRPLKCAWSPPSHRAPSSRLPLSLTSPQLLNWHVRAKCLKYVKTPHGSAPGYSNYCTVNKLQTLKKLTTQQEQVITIMRNKRNLIIIHFVMWPLVVCLCFFLWYWFSQIHISQQLLLQIRSIELDWLLSEVQSVCISGRLAPPAGPSESQQCQFDSSPIKWLKYQ